MGTSFSNILTGDIDGDGDTDVLAGDGTAGSIAVRLNTGSGIMSAATTMTIAAGTTLSAVEDINADGRDDVIATSGMNLYLRLATGAGNFASTSTTAWSGITMFPQIEDINQDGYMDLIGLDYMFPTVSIMLGNSSGFSSAQSISRSTSSSSLHNSFLVDLNNDGFKDVFLYDIDMLSGESMTVLQGTVQSEDPTSIDLTDQESAEDALEVLDRAIGKISERRAEIGALQNRLTSAINANSLTMENLSSAYSQIMDTDIAQETAELTRSQIQQQAAAAVLGQANIALQMAIQLLNS
jgi:flagellin